MGRFSDAKLISHPDFALMLKYNYLVDLLDQGYSTEGLVGSKVMRVDINPDETLSVKADGEEVFGVDDGGRVFASAISNISNSGYYMTYGYGGSPGMECFYPYTDPGTGAITTERFFAVVPTVYGGIMIYGLDGSQDSVLREEFGTDGSYNLYDEDGHAIISVASDGTYAVKDISEYERFKIYADGSSEDFIIRDSDNKIRVHSYADGGFEIVDTSGQQVFAAQGGAYEDVYLACKNDNTMQVGINSTGPYFKQGGAQTYMSGLVKKSEVLYSTLTLSADQTFATSSSSSVVQFDGETGDCSLSSYGCKIPTGNFIAIVSGYVRWDASAVGMRLAKIRLNSTDYNLVNQDAVSSGVMFQNVCSVFPVTTDDIIYLYVYQSSGGDLNLDLNSKLYVTLIPTD